MEKNNTIIKIGTLTLFVGLILGFVALKSGCIPVDAPNELETENKKELSNTNTQESELVVRNIRRDTVKIQGDENYVVTKRWIGGSKSIILLDADEIYSILHKDSVPKGFQPTLNYSISAKEYEKYKRKINDEKIDVIIPSSKSAPIFQEDD